MPRLKAANQARTTLTQAIDAVQTSFTVANASIFPDPPFRITVENEIMEVGAKDNATNTFSSVLRGQEGTTAASHANGTPVENRFTAGTYDELTTQAALDAHLADNAAHDIPSHFDPTTGHKHTGAAGDGPQLTHDAINTAAISAFRAYQSTAQSIAASTWTKVAFQTEEYDHLGEYDPTTYVFTPLKSGLYFINAGISITSGTADGNFGALRVFVNDVEKLSFGNESLGSATYLVIAGSGILKLNAGDQVSIWILLSANLTLRESDSATFFSAVRIA